MALTLPRLWQPLGRGRRLGNYMRVSWPWPLLATCYLVLAGFALFYGFAFGIFSALTIVPFLAPLALLAMLVVWAMPALRIPPVKAMARLMVAFTFALLIWPDYIALSIGNLPWITALRLIGIPLSAVFLTCYIRSPAFRRALHDILRPSREVTWLLLAFTAVATATLALSSDISFSIQRHLVFLYTGFFLFFSSAYYFSKPGRVRRFSIMLLVTTVFSVAVSLYEARYEHLPWVGRIPSFLTIEDPHILMVLAGSARAATGVYRVQSKFSTSIGLGEYAGLVVPFLIHLGVVTRSRLLRGGLIALLPLIVFVTLRTQSRLAFVCLLSSFLLYILIKALLTWRDRPESIFAPAITLAYLGFLALVSVLALTWRRLSNMIFGGGAEAASTQGRRDQWAGTWPLVERNPFGYGSGRAADTLHYVAPGSDFPTVDSYFITMLLDVGVLGFLLFFAIFLTAIGRAGFVIARTRNDEVLCIIPAFIALINFVVSKSVYSQTENQPLAFMVIGIVVALIRSSQADDGKPLPPVSEKDFVRLAEAPPVPRYRR